MGIESTVKRIFFGMELTNGIRRSLVSALMLLYLISNGASIVQATSLFAVSTVIMTLFEFPTGAIADHYSRKKSVIISFALMTLAFTGIFAFENFWMLCIERRHRLVLFFSEEIQATG